MLNDFHKALVRADICPWCLGELDTGFECNNCSFDAQDIRDDEVADLILSVPPHFALTNVASGCTKRSGVLSAVGQDMVLWVQGQTKVGINVFSLSGTPTLTFLGSTDGVNYNTLSVGAYPAPVSGAAPGGWYGNLPTTQVGSTTAAGIFEVDVGNLQFVKVQMTAAVGATPSAKVIIAASSDGSYQESFQTPTNIGVNQSVVYPSNTSTAADLNTLTIPAVPNATINLTFCEVSMAGGGAGGNPQLRVWDNAVGNGVPLYSCFLTTPVGSVGTVQKVNLPEDAQRNVGVQGTPGNALVIQIRNLGNTASVINTRVSYL